MAEQPTAEEIAAYEAQFGPAPKPSINPLRDLSAEDIAALAVSDKEHFVIPDEFARAKELHGDPAFVQKVADAFNIVNQRGFKVEDLPTVPQAAKAVGTAIKGLAGQAWNYASAAGGIVAGAASELVGAEGLAGGYAEGVSKTLAKNIAGTEESMTGLSQLAQKGTRKAGQFLNIAKEFSEYTPEEKVTELFDKAGESEVRGERLTGKGEFSKAVTGGQGGELDPEEVGTLAAGDPFSFYLFGAASKLAGKAVKAVTPAIVRGAAAAATQAAGRVAERVVPGVVGGALTAAGVTAKGAAKAVEAVAPVAGAVGGGVAGGASFLGVPGAIAGIGAGLASGKAIARGAAFVGRKAEKLADVGRQVAGSAPIKSAYARGAQDFLQALPGAAGDIAKGTALDIGLAAATAEVPQDVQGAVGFGTALGTLRGAAKVGGRVLSGQLVAPRNYGVNTVLPSSGQFPGFDAMHADAVKAATPGVRARLNAWRQFAEGIGGGKDIFIGRDAAAVEKALLSQGLDPAVAEGWSQAEGFFIANLPGKDGKPRRVIIATNVDSVPHEAQHMVQDVLGEAANQHVDKLVKDTYADRWDIEGQKYADRITEGRDPRHWREVILDETGTGLSEAKEKIYRDIHNRLEAESGAPPSPRFVEELAKMDLGSRMDAAVSRHPNADPNAIGQHVWRDVFSDSPGDVVALSDKYIARELAAENFDAIAKNQGPRLAEGTQLPEQLARIIGRVISTFGGEPLSGRVSELGGTPLSSDVIAAVRSGAKGLQGETPLVTPRAPSGARPRVLPGTIADAAEEARTLAAEAPDTALPGASMSQKEILGTVAEIIADKGGARYNYRNAPDVPGAAEEASRAPRRAEIEKARNMPEDLRRMTETTGIPYRIAKSSGGVIQVLDWAPDMLASNALRVSKALSDLAVRDPNNPVLQKIPHGLDVQNREWTEQGWRDIFADAEIFSANQGKGFAGSGIPLEFPPEVVAAGRTAPAITGTPVPLEQGRADFINMLYNLRVPNTPRQGAKLPGNLVSQRISEATLPGRTTIPALVEPRKAGETGVRKPFKSGEEILDPNPLRAEFETALQAQKIPLPDGIEVVRRLNLEHIADVVAEPNLPKTVGGVTPVLQAGLAPPAIQQRATERSWRISGQVRGANKQITVNAPDIAAARKLAEAQNMRISRVENADKAVSAQLAARTDTGRRVAEERGFEIRHTGTPANPGVAMFKDGAPVGEISAVRNSAIEADIDNIKVNQGFRGQGLSEILYREMGKRLQDEGVENVTGMIIDKRALAGRSKIFPETKIESEIQIGEGAPAYEVRSTISPTAQFNPVEMASRVEKFTPDEFRVWASSPEGANNNFTGVAHDVGTKAPDRAFVDSLLQRYNEISPKATAAIKAHQWDDASSLAAQGQFFREAYEAATGTASAGDALRKADPNFKPPFPIEGAQLAPPRKKSDKGYVADEFWVGRGKVLNAPDGHERAAVDYLQERGQETHRREDRYANYGRMEIEGFVRGLKSEKVLRLDASEQSSRWEDLSPDTRRAVENAAVDQGLKVIFGATEVMDFSKEPISGQLAPPKIKTKEEVQKIAAAEVARMAADHPEALPLDYQKNADGTFKLKDGAPIPIKKNYDLRDTPLARAAAAGHETKAAKEAAIVDAYAEKIVEAHAEAAKNPAIIAGKNWYELTRIKLRKLFGEDTKLFAEILGATSARTPVDLNFRFAIDAYNKFKAGDYDGIITKYKKGKAIWDSGDLSAARALDTENFLGENPTRAKFREFWIKHHDLKPKQSNGKLFGFNSGAVLRVLDGSWRAEIDAPKTPNFADNLSGDSFEATIDVWAARLMRRLGHGGSEVPWRILAKNEAGVADPDFYMSQKAFRKAGDELDVSPDSLQAIVWFLEKDLWDKSGWTTTADAAKKSDFNEFLDITTRDADKLTINEVRTKAKADVTAQLAAPKKGPVVVEPKKAGAIVAMPQEDAEKIADAIYKAEGGAKAKKPYGILSVKVANEAEARRVALNTIKNNYKRWQAAGKPGGYLEFLAGKYAPIGVANDPKSLNKNWLKNVKALLAK